MCPSTKPTKRMPLTAMMTLRPIVEVHSMFRREGFEALICPSAPEVACTTRDFACAGIYHKHRRQARRFRRVFSPACTFGGTGGFMFAQPPEEACDGIRACLSRDRTRVRGPSIRIRLPASDEVRAT